MALREIESTLPPGFRFYPSDEELVCHYLYKKVANQRIAQGTLVEVDLHAREPWELPDVAKLTASEWYFFSFRDRKYATGSRTNRATKTGYWKATGKDREVRSPATRAVVGMRKTLVFYQGRAPNGVKSGWVMHEFRLDAPHSPPTEDWVLCRVFQKTKGDGDGQDGGAGGASSPTLTGSSHVMAPEQEHHASYCGDDQYGGPGFVPQQQDVAALATSTTAVLPYYGGTAVDRHGSFPRDGLEAGALPVGFEFGARGVVTGDEYGFSGYYFDNMAGFDEMANHHGLVGGTMGSFPQGWN